MLYANPAIVLKNSCEKKTIRVSQINPNPNPDLPAQQLTPNNTNMPNNSTPNPISGHFIRMSSTPAQNASVPFHFCFRAKKTNVRCGPSNSVMPTRNRMLPIASRARSKKRIRPRRKKKPPPLQNATPISVGGYGRSALFLRPARVLVSSRELARTHSASRITSR